MINLGMKGLLPVMVVALVGVSTPAIAADEAETTKVIDVEFTLAGFSDYRFRGLSLSGIDPAFQPEIVVMDIGMPGMDGYDAARLIRQQPGGAGMVLIAVTGWGQAADKKRASVAGFDHHLVKPVDYELLMQCLQN